MLTENDIIQNPGKNWLKRLRKGNRVWLSKERRIAQIEWPYEFSAHGYQTGVIGLNEFGASWYIDPDGRGIDESRLMQPLKGELLDDPPELPATEIRHIHRQLETLRQRVTYLERVIELVVPDHLWLANQ